MKLLVHGRLAALAATVFVAVAACAQDDRAPASSVGGSLTPTMAAAFAPLLASWIVESRDVAVAQGVEPMPAEVRHALAGYVPEAILDRVRWRAGDSGSLTLQRNIFQFGEAPAMVLDHVVVFADAANGPKDAKLWAHEIKHVMQFAEWGVSEFALRYLRDYAAVEHDAAEFRWQWMKAEGLTPAPSVASEPAPE